MTLRIDRLHIYSGQENLRLKEENVEGEGRIRLSGRMLKEFESLEVWGFGDLGIWGFGLRAERR